MPELNMLSIAIAAVAAVVAAIIAWIVRGYRASHEKATVNSSWQDQFESQRTEHERLAKQNKGLMEQISQYQASNKDAKNRAKELSEAVQQAFARRDELQREIKDIRGNLEVVLSEKEKLLSASAARVDSTDELARKDSRIAKLENEVRNWQSRLPPLLENFRQKTEDVERLNVALAAANERIEMLEAAADQNHTRIEPVRDPEALTDGRDASNDSELRDRLQSIKGIGPAIEKTLNELGIFRFHQIAEMSEYDIDRVADRLKGFRSRIYREDWVGQARELRDRKASG